MPPLLAHLLVHPARDEMVIRQRDPVPLADLARLRPRRRPHRRRARHGPYVLGDYPGEEVGDVAGVSRRGEDRVHG